MYKKTLGNIFYICVFYTILLSATLLIIFSMVATNDMQSSFEKENGFIKSEFEKINTQNAIISGDVFSSENVEKYVNNGDKYAKYKFQRELGKYADLVAPAIKCIAVYKSDDNDLYCSNGAKTLRYYAGEVGTTEKALSEKLENVKVANKYRSVDYFVGENVLTTITYSNVSYEDVFLLVTFNMEHIFSDAVSDGKDIILFREDNVIYGTDEGLYQVAQAMLAGEKSFFL